MDWHAKYVEAVTLDEDGKNVPLSASQQTSGLPTDKVVAFLDLLLTQEGGEWWTKLRHLATQPKNDGLNAIELSKGHSDQLQAFRDRLAFVGGHLLIQLPELNASVNCKEPRVSKVRSLQLQLVCRALYYGALRNKKMERKRVKKEIRGLMDRVALLLDAANPPSLGVEDADERSPFQQFLLQDLAPRFKIFLPKLVQYWLTTFELAEDDINGDNDEDTRILKLHPVIKPPELPASCPEIHAADKQNIVASLLQERPAKRACSDISGLFKEVHFSHQRLQKQMHSKARKPRRVIDSSLTEPSTSNVSKSAGNQSAVLRPDESPTVPGKKSMQQSRSQASSKSAKTRSTSINQKMREQTLLHCATAANRSVKGSNIPLYTKGMSGRSQHQSASYTSTNSTARNPIVSENIQSQPKHRTKATSSIVMRTPERPKRMAARTTRRILVDASPPLHKPNRSGAASCLLQPKSVRPNGSPPSLFR